MRRVSENEREQSKRWGAGSESNQISGALDEPSSNARWLSREFVPVSIVLRFHLGQELDEFGRLSDAVQISIAVVSRIKVKTSDGGFS